MKKTREPDVRVRISAKPPKENETDTILCNWCAIEHPCTPEYKADAIARGAAKLKEVGEDQLPNWVTPELTWTCGRCLLALQGLSVDLLKTDCLEHHVPPERQIDKLVNNGND